jgi:hypothetical protein
MLERRKVWLERIANWGMALAVPLVIVLGFKVLLAARDRAPPAAQAMAVPANAPLRVRAPEIDASAPPAVDLRPEAARTEDRCTALEREVAALDAEANAAPDPVTAGRLRDRSESSRATARALRCRRGSDGARR